MPRRPRMCALTKRCCSCDAASSTALRLLRRSSSSSNTSSSAGASAFLRIKESCRALPPETPGDASAFLFFRLYDISTLFDRDFGAEGGDDISVAALAIGNGREVILSSTQHSLDDTSTSSFLIFNRQPLFITLQPPSQRHLASLLHVHTAASRPPRKSCSTCRPWPSCGPPLPCGRSTERTNTSSTRARSRRCRSRRPSAARAMRSALRARPQQK